MNFNFLNPWPPQQRPMFTADELVLRTTLWRNSNSWKERSHHGWRPPCRCALQVDIHHPYYPHNHRHRHRHYHLLSKSDQLPTEGRWIVEPEKSSGGKVLIAEPSWCRPAPPYNFLRSVSTFLTFSCLMSFWYPLDLLVLVMVDAKTLNILAII